MFDLDMGGHGVGGVLCVGWYGRKSRQSDEVIRDRLTLEGRWGIDDASFRRRLAGFGVRLGIVRLNGFNVSEMAKATRKSALVFRQSTIRFLQQRAA